MPIGSVTNRALKPVSTSAGIIHAPEKSFGEMSAKDIVDLVQTAARKRDGQFLVTASAEGAGGITLTVTTNAGVVTIGPLPFPRDSVTEALDYLTREGTIVDGL